MKLAQGRVQWLIFGVSGVKFSGYADAVLRIFSINTAVKLQDVNVS
jgi:hypothetical protein